MSSPLSVKKVKDEATSNKPELNKENDKKINLI